MQFLLFYLHFFFHLKKSHIYFYVVSCAPQGNVSSHHTTLGNVDDMYHVHIDSAKHGMPCDRWLWAISPVLDGSY